MSCVKLNILANFAGQGWSALMQLALVPLYLKFLGIEAYGLIGFYITLQAALQILDLGLSPTMTREMARYSAMPEKAAEARDLVRTLEVGYWGIGIAIGAVILSAAPLIATHWIRAGAIPTSVVLNVVRSMGVLAALQWPLSFYQGGLMGLQRQVLLNGVKIGMMTLGSGGAVLILWLVSPTITAFFKWQIVVSAIYVTLITVSFWRSLPPCDRVPRFAPHLLRNIRRFAAGMGGIALSLLVLTQLDKVILSHLLSLEMFGYYTLAGVVGYGLYIVTVSVVNAIFPQFSSMVARGDESTLKHLYHRSAQMVAVLILPIAAVVSFFSFDVLLLWTGNAEAARNAAPIASVLVIGTALNGLMTTPYALQLAYGLTGITLRIHIVLIIIAVPAIFFMTTRYGAVGAAMVWVASQTIYVLFGVPLTHKYLLHGEARRWFVEDVGFPLAGALLVVGVGRWLIVSPMTPGVAFVSLSVVLFGSLAAAFLAAPQTRLWLTAKIKGKLLYA
jgi:O-antigen/teichoic acid export membrane protein